MLPQIVYVLLSADVDGTNTQFHGVVVDEKVADVWYAADPTHRTALEWEIGKIEE